MSNKNLENQILLVLSNITERLDILEKGNNAPIKEEKPMAKQAKKQAPKKQETKQAPTNLVESKPIMESYDFVDKQGKKIPCIHLFENKLGRDGKAYKSTIFNGSVEKWNKLVRVIKG